MPSSEPQRRRHQRFRDVDASHEAPRDRAHRSGPAQRRDGRDGVPDRHDRRVRRHHRCGPDMGDPLSTSAMGLGEPPAAIAAIGMGRYGGQEVNFSSDADMILLYTRGRRRRAGRQPVRPQGGRRAAAGAGRPPRLSRRSRSTWPSPRRQERPADSLVRLLPGVLLVMGEHVGTSGAAARPVRRRDRVLGEDFLHDIANPLRYPISPLTDAQLGEIRKLKARMEAERLPRGVRRDRHLKLGKGGLSDVESTVQLLQLQHAGDNASLRLNSTLATLDELERRRFIDRGDAAVLRKAWRMCTDPQRQLPVERTRLAGRHPARRHVFAGRHRRVSGIRCPPWAAFRKRPDGNDAQGPRRGRASVLWTLI